MNSFKTALLLTAMMLIFMAIGGAAGGRNGMIIMFGLSVLMNFGSYWFSDKIVLKMYGAREVTAQSAPELVRLVSGLAKKAGLPMPKVYVMDSEAPNAFATGRNPANAAVAVTSGIMRALSYEELEGVLAHELGHVKNRDTLISTIAATFAGTISMVANIVKWGAILGTNRGNSDDDNGGALGALAMAIIAPIAAMLIQLAISRSREYLADETGARMCGKPLALASALKKIENYSQHRVMASATPATSHMFIINPLAGTRSSLASLFSTHPSTSDRIIKLHELAAAMR